MNSDVLGDEGKGEVPPNPEGGSGSFCMKSFSKYEPNGRDWTSEHSLFCKRDGKSWQVSPMVTVSEPWKLTEGLRQPRQDVSKENVCISVRTVRFVAF